MGMPEGFVPAPNVRRLQRLKGINGPDGTVHVARENIPRCVVAEVVVNPNGIEFVGHDNCGFFTPEFLLNNLYFNVPLRRFRSRHVIHEPPYYGRVQTIGTCNVEINGTLTGRTITAKGGGRSGAVYSEQHTGYPEPLGFFGDRDAQTELELSSIAISERLRSSLTLGFVVLDSKELINWLTSVFYNDRRYLRHQIDALEIVGDNGDRPCIHFRIGSNHGRIEGPYLKPQALSRYAVEGLRAIMHDIDKFRTNYPDIEIPKIPLQQLRGEFPGYKESMHILEKFYFQILDLQIIYWQILAEKDNRLAYLASTFRHENLDFALCHYDYELPYEYSYFSNTKLQHEKNLLVEYHGFVTILCRLMQYYANNN